MATQHFSCRSSQGWLLCAEPKPSFWCIWFVDWPCVGKGKFSCFLALGGLLSCGPRNNRRPVSFSKSCPPSGYCPQALTWRNSHQMKCPWSRYPEILGCPILDHHQDRSCMFPAIKPRSQKSWQVFAKWRLALRLGTLARALSLWASRFPGTKWGLGSWET